MHLVLCVAIWSFLDAENHPGFLPAGKVPGRSRRTTFRNPLSARPRACHRRSKGTAQDDRPCREKSLR